MKESVVERERQIDRQIDTGEFDSSKSPGHDDRAKQVSLFLEDI